jgi:hypothetical protein
MKCSSTGVNNRGRATVFFALAENPESGGPRWHTAAIRLNYTTLGWGS